MPQWVLRGEAFRSRFRGDIRALSDGISGYRTPRSTRSSSWSVRRSGRSGRRGACLHAPISSTGPAQSHRAVSEGQRNSRVEVRHQHATLRDRSDGDNAYETAKHGSPFGKTVGIEAGWQPGLSEPRWYLPTQPRTRFDVAPEGIKPDRREGATSGRAPGRPDSVTRPHRKASPSIGRARERPTR
jgi:hypothetical protein